MLRQIVKLQLAVQSKLSSDRGATAVEYGLLVALIAAVIVVVVGLLGKQIQAAFTTVNTAITPATTP